MRVYIAGAIQGVADYEERFAEAEYQIRAKGDSPVNPAKIGRILEETIAAPGWKDYMTVTSAYLHLCDAVYFIPGWEFSKGAVTERLQALKEGKEFYIM